LAKAKILIVDDESITRENLALILGKEGYDTVVAAGGAEAIRALEATDFDLVLTDLKMKDLDGIEVLEQAHKLRPDTEVIMLTGYATVATAVEAMRKGAYHYIPKPFKVEELQMLVEKALEKRRMRTEISKLRQRI